MKDYLSFENSRNKQHADLYVRLLKRALREEKDIAILIGHHLTFELNGDLNTENEIPSADCLMFDHDLMYKAFGPSCFEIMKDLALAPVDSRDRVLEYHLSRVEKSVEIPSTIPA